MAKKTDALTKESPEGVSFVRVGDNDYRQVCSSSNACAGVVHFLWVTWILYVIPIYMLYSYVFTNNCVSIGSILHFIWTDCICVCRLIGSGARIPIRWSMMECNIGHDMYQALTFIILCVSSTSALSLMVARIIETSAILLPSFLAALLRQKVLQLTLSLIISAFRSCSGVWAMPTSESWVQSLQWFYWLVKYVYNAFFKRSTNDPTKLNETYFAGMHNNICFFYQLITYGFRFQSNFLCVNAFIYVSYFLLVFLLHLS